jgi:glycosyltransferase involved in cell wall biosynthesis
MSSISVVVPFLNEEHVAERTLRDLCDTLSIESIPFEILAVDDGSGDATGAILDRCAREQAGIRVIHHPQNLGYGRTLSRGFREAEGDCVAIFDGDGQFEARDLARAAHLAELGDCVLGFRHRRADNAYRRRLAQCGNLVGRRQIGFPVVDIDCALKVIRRELLSGVELRSLSGFVSTELLALMGLEARDVIQIPVAHRPRLAGRAGGGSLKGIVGTIDESVRFEVRRRRERALIAPGAVAPT